MLVNILFTSGWLNMNNHEILKSFGITVQQFNIMRILKGQHPHPVSINDLISRMLDKNSNASRLVEKLKQKEIAERKECPEDRRRVEVKLTEKGILLLKEINDKLENSPLYQERVSPEEASEVNRILDKLRG